MIMIPGVNSVGSCVFFPESLCCPTSTTLPGDNIRSSPPLQMSLPPGNHQTIPDYRCTCRKCRSNGKILPRVSFLSKTRVHLCSKFPALVPFDRSQHASRPSDKITRIGLITTSRNFISFLVSPSCLPTTIFRQNDLVLSSVFQ